MTDPDPMPVPDFPGDPYSRPKANDPDGAPNPTPVAVGASA